MPQLEHEEQVLFHSEAVVVTDRRILFRTRSYAASAVSSVRVSKGRREGKSGIGRHRGPEFYLAVAMVVFGAGIGAGGALLSQDTPALMVIMIAIGGVVSVVGVLLAAVAAKHPAQTLPAPYTVRIATVNGEKERVTGLDHETARRLANAISTATARD